MGGWKESRWDWWAPLYDPLVRRLSRARRRAISLARLKPHETVLIPGAGTGLDLELLPPLAHIAVVEQSPQMLDRLRRRADRLDLEVEELRGDATAMPFPDESFDCVLLHLIVAVVDSPEQVLREARRVLRKDGRIVVFDKFAADEGPVPWLRKLANRLTRVVATDITLRLAPLAEEANLRVVLREPAGLGGFLQVAILKK